MADTNSRPQHEHWKVLVLILKNIAEDKGITHQQIADETKLAKQNVTRFFSLRNKPGLDLFLDVARAVGVNFFIEDKDADTDLGKIMEKAMDQLGRRAENLPKN